MSVLTELDREILIYLRIVGSTDVEDIAEVLSVSERSVQEALHKLDDSGHVIMRCGWYRISEAAKTGRI